ncbi:VWA domain-containing protein [Rhizobium sp. BK176]|uniref:VWA domain-containing protein n=1 Tax=Rhizobium sp. BK176 TaxID=2587071 RepID=UPI00216777E8|nr:VWA domain-containing protein [Rhizobium sp. BK176]MCS4088817.1 hypothetical protein [Rhizobium sp. BK176]
MPELEVASAVDVSGSFLGEHRAGLTSTFLTRIVPWGITFDPDGKIDIFTFSDGPASAHYVGYMDASNYADYVATNIVDKVPGWGGATDYAHVLRMILAHFGWGEKQEDAPLQPKKTGFFARLFGAGKPSAVEQPQADEAPRRAIVFFVTDGVGDDPEATTKVIGDAEREGHETFFVMVGMSNRSSEFPLLAKLAAKHGNVIFRKIEDIAAFNAMSDEKLNEFFLDEKLTAWLSR